jgi:probable HAF family extracellular repeat protein
MAMNDHHHRGTCALAAVLAVLGTLVAPGTAGAAGSGLSGSARCRPVTTVTSVDLGTLGGAITGPSDIDDRGVVVGSSETATSTHGFRWRRGTLRDVTPGALSGWAKATNGRGQLLIDVLDGAGDRGLLWSHGTLVDLTSGEPGSHTLALNERGQVVVQRPDRLELWDHGVVRTIIEAFPGSTLFFADLSDRGHVAVYRITPSSHGVQIEPFVWHRGTLTPVALTVPPDDVVYIDPVPVGVDDRGRVLLNASRNDGGEWVPAALLWDGGVHIDLGSLGADQGSRWTTATDLNDRGQVVGHSRVPGDFREHAFLWEGGHMTDLGTLGAGGVEGNSSARRINDRGQVIGTSDGPGGQSGFVWACGTMVDLGNLGEPFVQPVDINERGQVVSDARLATGEYRAMLSTW